MRYRRIVKSHCALATFLELYYVVQTANPNVYNFDSTVSLVMHTYTTRYYYNKGNDNNNDIDDDDSDDDDDNNNNNYFI